MRGRFVRCLGGVAALAGMLTGVGRVEANDGERLKRDVESVRRAQAPSGLLRYDFDFLAGASSGQNDPVRQAGVIAFLCEYFVASGDASVKRGLAGTLLRFGELV